MVSERGYIVSERGYMTSERGHMVCPPPRSGPMNGRGPICPLLIDGEFATQRRPFGEAAIGTFLGVLVTAGFTAGNLSAQSAQIFADCRFVQRDAAQGRSLVQTAFVAAFGALGAACVGALYFAAFAAVSRHGQGGGVEIMPLMISLSRCIGRRCGAACRFGASPSHDRYERDSNGQGKKTFHGKAPSGGKTGLFSNGRLTENIPKTGRSDDPPRRKKATIPGESANSIEFFDFAGTTGSGSPYRELLGSCILGGFTRALSTLCFRIGIGRCSRQWCLWPKGRSGH